MYFTPMLRHLDRGSQQPDGGEYSNFEYVFGATAAAALYRREMIEDVALNGEFFDNDFFVYREDADVAWRHQLLGWRCLYTPFARAYHVRNVLPGNRRALPPEINMHSVKNRFLMRIKNITPDLYRRNFLAITVRDVVVISCCILWEHTSLRAFPLLFRNWRNVVAKRREIMARGDDTTTIDTIERDVLTTLRELRTVLFELVVPDPEQGGLGRALDSVMELIAR